MRERRGAVLSRTACRARQRDRQRDRGEDREQPVGVAGGGEPDQGGEDARADAHAEHRSDRQPCRRVEPPPEERRRPAAQREQREQHRELARESRQSRCAWQCRVRYQHVSRCARDVDPQRPESKAREPTPAPRGLAVVPEPAGSRNRPSPAVLALARPDRAGARRVQRARWRGGRQGLCACGATSIGSEQAAKRRISSCSSGSSCTSESSSA